MKLKNIQIKSFLAPVDLEVVYVSSVYLIPVTVGHLSLFLPQSKVITISNSFNSFKIQQQGFELEPNEKIIHPEF